MTAAKGRVLVVSTDRAFIDELRQAAAAGGLELGYLPCALDK